MGFEKVPGLICDDFLSSIRIHCQRSHRNHGGRRYHQSATRQRPRGWPTQPSQINDRGVEHRHLLRLVNSFSSRRLFSNEKQKKAGHVAFFNIISEMTRPEDFTKSVCLVQTISTSFYLLCAFIIYWFKGPDVPSPALSAAPPLWRKVAYGLAAPTIVIAGVVNGHVAVKYMYLRFWQWRGKRNVIFERSWRARGSWYLLTVVAWTAAWLLAEAVPSFNHILALVSALFCGWFSCKSCFSRLLRGV